MIPQPASGAEIPEQQRLDMFAVYLSIGTLHHLTFDQALENRAIFICLKNTAAARRKALRQRAEAANADVFELTPPPGR